jgi:hypothetical protein
LWEGQKNSNNFGGGIRERIGAHWMSLGKAISIGREQIENTEFGRYFESGRDMLARILSSMKLMV